MKNRKNKIPQAINPGGKLIVTLNNSAYKITVLEIKDIA